MTGGENVINMKSGGGNWEGKKEGGREGESGQRNGGERTGAKMRRGVNGGGGLNVQQIYTEEINRPARKGAYQDVSGNRGASGRWGEDRIRKWESVK